MEKVELTLLLDEGYRQAVEARGVNFEHYLLGLLAEHFIDNGEWDKWDSLCFRLDRGKVSAKALLANRVGLGKEMSTHLVGGEK